MPKMSNAKYSIRFLFSMFSLCQGHPKGSNISFYLLTMTILIKFSCAVRALGSRFFQHSNRLLEGTHQGRQLVHHDIVLHRP